MAAQTTTSGLAKKYGNLLNAAVAKHAGDEVDYGFQRLPAGIANGIAQVSKCYFAQYHKGEGLKGEYYLRMEAVVVSPQNIVLPDGSEMRVAGLTTSVMRPMCETKNSSNEVTSLEENVAAAMNELRKLGAATEACKSGDDLEKLVAAVAKSRPFTRFATSERKPRPGTNDQPGVWENWNGSQGLEDYKAPSAEGGVQDDTTTADVDREIEAENSGGDNIEGMIDRAIGGSQEAQNILSDMADKLDGDAKAIYDSVTAWEMEGAKGQLMIAFGLTTAEEVTEEVQEEVTEEVQEEEPKIKVGGTYKYKPLVKVNGKNVRSTKAITVKVESVNADKQKADIKSLSDNKVVKGVDWAVLEA